MLHTVVDREIGHEERVGVRHTVRTLGGVEDYDVLYTWKGSQINEPHIEARQCTTYGVRARDLDPTSRN